ncbi:MAG: phosphoglycerate dehydrogenase [Calditrichaceae bacterium]
MYKILVSDSLPADILAKYDNQEGITVENKSGIPMDDLKKIIPEYDGLIVRSRTKVTADILEQATRLKVIGRAGAGVDNIDSKEATKRGIIVMNTPGGNTIAATEHSIALMLSALRNIPKANASILQEKWDRKSFIGHELYEKTIGIIGLGKIGREVAKRLSAFGANLIGYDPILTTEIADRLGVKLVDLDQLLEKSDIISVHAPKMPETIDMINANNLKLCKDGVVIVNCARGGIVNEKDLIAALDSGKVGCAAIDVFSSEPPTDFTLAKHPNCLATPHLGASTEEAQVKVADQILQQMIEYFNKNVAKNAVNYVSVDEELQPIIAPFYELAMRLGTLFNQIKAGRLKEVAVRYYGTVLNVPVEPITAHLLVGALKSQSDGKDVEIINAVNSLAIAREKGISIEIAKKDLALTSHTNVIACDFVTESETIHVAGTYFAQNIFHLIEYCQFNIDADLNGQMIIIGNDDIPGIIGKAGTIFAENKINIGHLSSSRKKDTKLALNIFNVEGNLKPELKSKLEQIAGVKRVLIIKLN